MKKGVSTNILNGIFVISVVLSGSVMLFNCDNPSNPVPPEIVLSTMKDTTVRAGDNFHLGVDVIGGDFYGMHFIWQVDNSVDTSREYRKTFNWQFSDTGLHTVIVSALNRHMLMADPETLLVRVTSHFPTINASQNDTTVLWGDTLRINPAVSDSDGVVTAIRWKTDLDSLWYSAVPAPRVFTWGRLQVGTHYILMRSVDDNNLMSAIDTVVVQVKNPSSKLHILEKDTTLQLLTSMVIHTAFDEALPQKHYYRWMIDTAVAASAVSDTFTVAFGNKQIGKHQVSVHLLNADSSLISSDTIGITVMYVRVKPTLSIGDTTVFANQILTVASIGCQPDDVDTLSFSVDSLVVKKTKGLDTLQLSFNVADSGTHTVELFVKDPDGIESGSEKVKVVVLPGIPQVKFPEDTILRADETLQVAASVSDVNGFIISAQWFYDGIKIDTSLFTVSYHGKETVVLSAVVQDNDSLVGYDTMIVHFNAPPALYLQRSLSDTLYCTETNPVASASIGYTFFDKENDTLGVKISITKSGQDTVHEFIGGRDSVTVSVNGPGVYYWLLKATDSFGSSVSVRDSFTVVMSHTICFVGHSVVSGMAGDGLSGGFRSTVLKGLRENLIPYHTVKATGPLVTPDMRAYPSDDSCYAISGAKGYEMLFFLREVYKKLNADIWVIMLGANSQYSTVETRNCIAIMDTLMNRNLQSKIYILTAPPFPDIDDFYTGNYYRPYFNKSIYDSVAVRNQNGAHISVVDADTLLTDTNMVFDSTWFSDHVHPNMEGYVRIGEKILSVMKSAGNPALKEELYLKEE
ncbi:MAG: SGNH/GDSL hydrolase family protein [Chitinispirillaceae bacterium]|nr:SGNH/GDSL hydrolase family protein [Chitinispirillaceae bacterium]